MLAHNSSTVNPLFEANLLSYHVFPRGEDKVDVNLKLHNVGGLLVVYQPDHLAELRKLGLDLAEGAHPNIKFVMIGYQQTGGHLTFVSARSNKLPIIKPMPGGEVRTARLMAFKSDDWCGTPTLLLKAFGETRVAEAAGLQQLDEIRALGLPIDAHKRGEWVYVPLRDGFTVQYNARKTGPKLEYITLERAATPDAPSTPTDAAPVLLPARAETLWQRTLKRTQRDFMKRWCNEHAYVDSFPSGKVIELPAVIKPVDPAILALLRGEEVVIDVGSTDRIPAPASAPNSDQMEIGENAYALISEKWRQLPREQRHEIMRRLDPLIEHALDYAKSGTGFGSVTADWDALRRSLYSVRSQLGATMPAPNPIQNLETVYATQQAAAAREAAAELKKLAKQWLRVRINPTSHEYVAQTKRENVKITYRLEGYGDNKRIRILLHAPILKSYQVSTEVSSKTEGKGAVAALWDTFDRRVKKMIEAQTSRRPDYKETRAPIMPPVPSRLH